MYYNRDNEFLQTMKTKSRKHAQIAKIMHFFTIFFAILCLIDSIYSYYVFHICPIYSNAIQYFFCCVTFILLYKTFHNQYNYLTFKQEQQVYFRRKYLYVAQTLNTTLVLFGLFFSGFVLIVLMQTLPYSTGELSSNEESLLVAAIAIGLLLLILFIPWLKTNLNVYRHIKTLYTYGIKYPAQIVACESKINSHINYRSLFNTREVFTGIDYILIVKFELDGKTLLTRTPALCDHPNSILKSPNCNIYVYNKSFIVTDFDLRTRKGDSHINVPTSHNHGAFRDASSKEEFIDAKLETFLLDHDDDIFYHINF